jgi:hypothetical protein
MAYALFKTDDSDDPGQAVVEMMRETKIKVGTRWVQCWRVRVIQVKKPSAIRTIKVGQRLLVARGLLSKISPNVEALL